eukprot:366387-Chlamydomonas_euryale.AAC.9
MANDSAARQCGSAEPRPTQTQTCEARPCGSAEPQSTPIHPYEAPIGAQRSVVERSQTVART